MYSRCCLSVGSLPCSWESGRVAEMQYRLRQSVMWGCELPFPHSDPGFLFLAVRSGSDGPLGARMEDAGAAGPSCCLVPTVGPLAGTPELGLIGNTGTAPSFTSVDLSQDDLLHVLKDRRWNSTRVTSLALMAFPSWTRILYELFFTPF